MIEKEILKLAADVYGCQDWTEAQLNRLRRFADLVAEHERELCMKAIEDEVKEWDREAKEAALEAAEAIRGTHD